MAKRYLHCLQRTDLPARAASTEPAAPHDGQANRRLIPGRLLGAEPSADAPAAPTAATRAPVPTASWVFVAPSGKLPGPQHPSRHSPSRKFIIASWRGMAVEH